MDEKTFNRQYAFANSTTARFVDGMVAWLWAKGLSNADLFEALCERIEERINIEESEISAILSEIASRLPDSEKCD